jgi:hypothetical protein
MVSSSVKVGRIKWLGFFVEYSNTADAPIERWRWRRWGNESQICGIRRWSEEFGGWPRVEC